MYTEAHPCRSVVDVIFLLVTHSNVIRYKYRSIGFQHLNNNKPVSRGHDTDQVYYIRCTCVHQCNERMCIAETLSRSLKTNNIIKRRLRILYCPFLSFILRNSMKSLFYGIRRVEDYDLSTPACM